MRRIRSPSTVCCACRRYQDSSSRLNKFRVSTAQLTCIAGAPHIDTIECGQWDAIQRGSMGILQSIRRLNSLRASAR